MAWPSINHIVQVLRMGFELFQDVYTHPIQKLLRLFLAALLQAVATAREFI